MSDETDEKAILERASRALIGFSKSRSNPRVNVYSGALFFVWWQRESGVGGVVKGAVPKILFCGEFRFPARVVDAAGRRACD
jgi:hypothetical protein